MVCFKILQFIFSYLINIFTSMKAWEKPFSKRIKSLRKKEVHKLRNLMYARAVNASLVFGWTTVVSLCTVSLKK